MSKKVITAGESAPARRVALPEFNNMAKQEEVVEDEPPEITEEEIEAIKAQAYQEGFKKGVEDGQAEIATQAEAFQQQLEHVISLYTKPLDQFDDQVEQELVRLAVSVAKQIVRRELKTDPNQVLAVIREAISALPMASQNVKFYVHPEDAAIVRSLMTPGDGEESWTLVEDPVIQRGGCRVETLTSEIDATVESRVAAIAASILGGERQDDK